jgi:DNA-binding transcriptional MerR regulator
MAPEHRPALSIDELVLQVQQRLRQLGLEDDAPDGRVSPLPDARTVRYYTTLGLMDRPQIVDREARYTERHVRQLAAIKRLQAEGVRLADVQRQLYGRSDAELQQLLATARRRGSGPTPVVWREVPIVPGLKLSAVEGWAADGDSDGLIHRIREALAALSARHAEKGRQ